MAYAIKARPNGVRARRDEEAQYRLVMAVAFAVFLVGALVVRLVPTRWRGVSETEQKSVVAEARAAAHRCVPFAFMN